MHPRLSLLALPLALAACNGGGAKVDHADDLANAQATPPFNSAAPAPTPTPAASAKPILLSQEDESIDFDYAIAAQAAAIPALRDQLLQRAQADKSVMLKDQAEYAREMKQNGFPVHPYGLSTKWKVAANTDRLLVLVAEGYRYTGGAHGSDFYEPLIWDRQTSGRVAFGDLFTDKDEALATIRKPFCDTLDKMRLKRRGGPMGEPGDYFNRCPDFGDAITLAPAKTVGGKFARIGVWIPADVAGSHAEGSYEYDLVIPKAMAELVKPEYRASFPGT
ncbi:DUF4163 domain-containing protein [Stakelama pacifica]|uniref:Uncharacterized protein DUF4163 n=1 Tax=Stakelama pacifica TaxID=517720 RepID=A0A4R6FV51_9SPHN|nr:DUF4163 domain-containing protein [Stakelama pacifica]TDN85713.1 uncharacterized protein DUF4163 [Stakelama pacifica]GGO91843.1 hypothetical protein GCM10011329_07480 [Stakelama pacifica]